MTAAPKSPTRIDASPHRRALIAKVHLGAKELGLDENTRRDLMERVTGQRSAADLNDRQLTDVLDEYRARGWTPTSAATLKPRLATSNPVATSSKRRPADHPVARKARALWISLHQLGVVRDPSEKALEAFGARQLGVERLVWADQGQGYRLIEALKAMAERAGWSQEGSLDAIKARLQALLEKNGLEARG